MSKTKPAAKAPSKGSPKGKTGKTNPRPRWTPKSTRGAECLDMILSMRTMAVSDDEIRRAVFFFWFGRDYQFLTHGLDRNHA